MFAVPRRVYRVWNSRAIRSDTGASPPLIVAEPVCGGAFVQRVLQTPQPDLVETTPATRRPFRREGLLTTGLPLLLPAVHRGRDTRNRAAICGTGTPSANQPAA
jgi:hypothetical protein